MYAAFLILVALILASPFVPLVNGNLVSGVEATAMAVAMALVARKSPPKEIQPLLGLFPLVLAVVSILAVWMIIQLLPLGYVGVANPIWESTQQALGVAIVGSIGIDTGAGLVGLIDFIAVLATLLVTMAVTRNRWRADRLLFALMISASITCVPLPELLWRLNIVSTTSVDAGVVRNIGILGVLLAVTATIRAFERWQSSRGLNLILSLAASAVSLSVCASALAMRWNSNVGFGLAFSLTVLLAIVVIRRLAIDMWGAAIIAAIVLTISISIVWVRHSQAADLMTAYSDDSASVPITQRILADTPWFGTGAGSFEILANVYREPTGEMSVVVASTAAAKIAVELGPPMTLIVVAAICITMAVSLRGALYRGRDWFYPALGASCLMALLIRGFADVRILAQSVSIVSATILGLALAQSIGRTSR